MTNHFRYKQQDIKVLARKRRNMSMYSPIGALICSSAHDRDYLFNAADHERFALDALANYPGAIKTLTKTRMEEHIRAGGGFQNRTMVEQALTFTKNTPFRRAYLKDRSPHTRALAVRHLPIPDLKTMTNDSSVQVLRAVFRWGDQSIQDELFPVLMANKTAASYKVIVKYAHSKRHQVKAKLLLG